MSLTYGSVCSGIEAATAAWHPLGWRPAFFSEIEAFPRAVLQHHYPDTPLHGDFTTIQAGDYEPIDLLVGGTPCQSFSVAGLRGGLDDDRGNLALEYLRLADRLRPRWLVWENVPGVLSSNGGRDFGSILGGMGELGYGFAYRVLDAQFFGLAQRRRRVFVVGYLGDWRRAAAVLFERHGLSGNPAPSREAREGPAGNSDACAFALGSHAGAADGDVTNASHAGGGPVGSNISEEVAYSLRAGRLQSVAHTLKGEGFDASEDGTGRGTPLVPVTYSIMPQNSGKDYKARKVDVAQPVMAAGPAGGNQGGDYIVHAIQAGALRENPDSGPDGVGVQADHAYTLEARAEVQAVAFALRGREGGAMAEVGGEVSNALRTPGGGASVPMVSLGSTCETMYGVSHADAAQTYPDQALRAVRDAVGEEAYSEWSLGVVAAFWPAEVLRSEVHGRGLRRATHDRDKLGDNPPSLAKAGAAGALQRLWEAGCVGRSPQGWRPPQRLAVELGAYLSELSHQGASPARLMLGLWRSSEGLGLLREALSALQEAWRPAHREDQPARLTSAVRRLTPRECERLMGFPDDFTLIPWRKGLAPDSPRYKALGNSMAVPCMRWIGERIAAVEALQLDRAAA